MCNRLVYWSLFACLATLCQWACPQHRSDLADPEHRPSVAGMTLVAPPSAFSGDPMTRLKDVHANWIAVVPYGFTRPGQPSVVFDSERQWWGERSVGAIETMRLAKAAGIKVMLKPQIWIPGSWTGELEFATAAEWTRWENAYRSYIMTYARLADSMEVDLFAIGTEFKKAISLRPTYWIELIEEVRSLTSVPLTYAANWDNYPNIPFWKELDYVGINAYFPLISDPTPGVSALQKAWQPWQVEVDRFYEEIKKPILFTEYGYLSVDGCAFNTWELEAKVKSLQINEQAQANALQALYQVWSNRHYWQGGFIWKWFPEGQGHEGYPERDYTPQHKRAEEVVSRAHFMWTQSATLP